jgi:AAA15 family ATPase/GTPase
MIDGFSISGYRSFGFDEVQIGDLAKLNVFIGKNNCGKSNILRFLKRIGAGSIPSYRNSRGMLQNPRSLTSWRRH